MPSNVDRKPGNRSRYAALPWHGSPSALVWTLEKSSLTWAATPSASPIAKEARYDSVSARGSTFSS
jgi:hypothetical protein